MMPAPLLFLCLASIHAFSCEWEAPDGHKFDFSALTKTDGYRVQDMVSTYSLNVCAPTDATKQCSDNNGMLCQYDLKSGDYVTTLAKATDASWGYIEPVNPGIGVKMTLQNGDMCQRNRPVEHTTYMGPHDTVYLFRCAPEQKGEHGILFGVVNELAQCLTVVTFHTHLACGDHAEAGAGPPAPQPQPTPGDKLPPLPEGGEAHAGGVHREGEGLLSEEEHRHGAFYLLFMGCLGLFGCYMMCGCVYNSQKYHTSGLDSCPNPQFWRTCPARCLECGNYVVERVRRCFGKSDYIPLEQSMDRIDTMS